MKQSTSNILFILPLIFLGIVSCGPSEQEKADIAKITCNIIGESRNMDAVVRIKEINSAREKIGEEPFLGSDDQIKTAYQYGFCSDLVLNKADYFTLLNQALTLREEIRKEEVKKMEEDKRIVEEKKRNEIESMMNSLDVDRIIEIVGLDEMKYGIKAEQEGVLSRIRRDDDYLELTTISASKGEKIAIKLETISYLPKTAMAHNFVLLDLNVDVISFARLSILARSNDYVSPEFEDEIIVNTKMLGGGEVDVVTFDVPNKPGNYVFLCSFPGHYAGGMHGVLSVR